MAVDIGALKKFQDLWGPVLESVPAVIDAVSKKEDMDRGIAEQKRLYEKAEKDVADAKAEAQRVRAEAQAEMQRLSDERTQMLASMEAERVAINNQIADQKADAKAKADALSKKIADAEAKLGSLDSDFLTKHAQAQAAHDQALADMEAEIKALEDRKGKAEKALEALRAKLG